MEGTIASTPGNTTVVDSHWVPSLEELPIGATGCYPKLGISNIINRLYRYHLGEEALDSDLVERNFEFLRTSD